MLIYIYIYNAVIYYYMNIHMYIYIYNAVIYYYMNIYICILDIYIYMYMTTHMHTLPLRRLGYPEHSGRLAGGKFVLCCESVCGGLGG